MDTITIKCSRCGHISVMASFSEGKCPNCGSPIVPSKKTLISLLSIILVHATVVAAAIFVMKFAYHAIQRFIYKTGGEDLAGLIVIIGVAVIAIYTILKRRKITPK